MLVLDVVLQSRMLSLITTMQQPHKDQLHKDLSIILSLSLVRRLVGELNHPGPRAELKELDLPKGLGEQVRKMVLGVDVARPNAPFLQTASDEVVPHPDVLATFMEDGVLCQGQSGLAVHPELLQRRSPSSRASQSA